MKYSDLRVLVVDDDVDSRYAIANILKKCGCEVVEAESVEGSITELQSNYFDIVFSDMRFHGDLGGEVLLEHMMQNYPNTDVVMVSSSMDKQKNAELIENGASYCLQKPLFRDNCLEVLGRLGRNSHKSA